ncbi:hypothetical protein [Paenibacillus motobuensis]|uniref:SprT-like domain-containing protein n=1 Tax=Paenibacillus motobuensis TaxID=295324 RepID=A0ABN0YBW1_9BACL
MQEVILTEEELRAKCAGWQKILRLQDWIVITKIKRDRDMTLEGVCGECSWQLSKRMAAINILDPIDYPPETIERHDMELTLVHELLHLHFAALHDQGGNETPEEQAIEAISRGLVYLARRGGERENVELTDLRGDGS